MKKILTFLSMFIAAVMLFFLTSIPTSAEEAAEASKTKLPAVLEAYWGDNYNVAWVVSNTEHNYFHVEIEQVLDDTTKTIYNGTWSTSANSATGVVTVQTSRYINESGTYRFRVAEAAKRDDTEFIDGDFTQWVYKEYKRPESVLGTTKAVWSTEKAGFFEYPAVKNAGGYLRKIYYKKDESSDARVISTSWGVSSSLSDEFTVHTGDITRNIESRGEGLYAISLTALSNNLDLYANGTEGELSDWYDTRQNADDLKEIIASMGSADASAVIDTLVESADITKIEEAMHTDEEFLKKIEELEDAYSSEKNIEVSSPVVSQSASQYVDTEKIAVIGAAFNAEAGNNVMLSVDSVAEENKVSVAGFKNSVQLDLKLVSGNSDIHQLVMPVTITMPIPAGINAAQFVLFHQKSNGAQEVVALHNNGDGTVTFTVSSFSTFIFAEPDAADDLAQQVRNFVERMYTVALSRESDAEGAAYWTEKLLAKEFDGAGLSAFFITSPEFISKGYSNTEYLNILYRTFFAREADSEGMNYWMNLLESGTSKNTVLSHFVNSEEFFHICSSYNISKGVLLADGTAVNPGIYLFCERLYSTVLERSGDKPGIEYWTITIHNKQVTPEQAATDFYSSDEYLAKDTTDSQYAKALYRTFMNREADDSGLNYWINQMHDEAASFSRQAVLQCFAASNEFTDIMRTYGLLP